MMNANQDYESFYRKMSYTHFKQIGSGAYGKVYSAKTLHGKRVAIKEIFDLRHVIDSIKLIRELKMLKHFNVYKHPNIIQLKDVYIKEPKLKYNLLRSPKSSYNEVCIVTDLVDIDLHKLIQKYRIKPLKNPLTEKHYEYFAAQLVSGLYYLASANIIHRDLKPSNIVINADCELKIIDFGLSRTKDNGNYNKEQTDYVVTRWYRAPEIILYNNEYGYDKQVDIWALGCVLAEMILKRPLFDGDDYKEQLKKILEFIELTDDDFEYLKKLNHKAGTLAFINEYKLTNSNYSFMERFRVQQRLCFYADNKNTKIPEAISDELILLIEQMLIINPERRITIEKLIEHPYFSDILYTENKSKGTIPVITSPKKFKIDYNFEEKLVKSDNIDLVKDHIYDEVITFHKEIGKK